ncbi:MAG: TIGR04219 family outer membrane beta-barrel protein [Sulfuricurvum sp.]|nr:TIGR04219 family outer membrane beta-barrel protein [Sulfuricurvum sp.]
MRSVILALCLGAASASAATILGFGAEADYYMPMASGDFSYTNNGVTTATHFSNDTTSAYQVGLFLEHPLPLIPNFRIDLTPDSSFNGSGNKVTLNQTDITPYYEILDNVVDLDVGMTFKVIDGKIEGVTSQSFKEVVPMGYLSVAITPPLSPLSVEGNVKYLGYGGDSFTDARVKANWKIAPGLAAQAGYRYESLSVTNHFGMNANVDFKGPFVGLNYRF